MDEVAQVEHGQQAEDGAHGQRGLACEVHRVLRHLVPVDAVLGHQLLASKKAIVNTDILIIMFYCWFIENSIKALLLLISLVNRLSLLVFLEDLFT